MAGRWSDLKSKQSNGTGNYITPGSYVLSLALFKHRDPGGRKEVFVIEADVEEVIAEIEIPMKGKGQKEAVLTKSKACGERVSIVWAVGKSEFPDTLLGEVAQASAAILGMTDKDRAECSDDDWEEGMDSLVLNNGEDFVGTKFICHVARKNSKADNHYCSHSFEPCDG